MCLQVYQPFGVFNDEKGSVAGFAGSQQTPLAFFQQVEAHLKAQVGAFQVLSPAGHHQLTFEGADVHAGPVVLYFNP